MGPLFQSAAKGTGWSAARPEVCTKSPSTHCVQVKPCCSRKLHGNDISVKWTKIPMEKIVPQKKVCAASEVVTLSVTGAVTGRHFIGLTRDPEPQTAALRASSSHAPLPPAGHLASPRLSCAPPPPSRSGTSA